MKTDKLLSHEEKAGLLVTLKTRFEKFPNRHEGINWSDVESKLHANSDKLWSLNEMENTGGEPDVVGYDEAKKAFIFFDCSPETPTGRRSLCYDREALDARKKFKPENSVIDLATNMGIELLDETQYRYLQSFGKFDTKTSSWIKTPANIRSLGGAIFGDFRYGQVFVYHNGADSYYGSRAFRGVLFV